MVVKTSLDHVKYLFDCSGIDENVYERKKSVNQYIFVFCIKMCYIWFSFFPQAQKKSAEVCENQLKIVSDL